MSTRPVPNDKWSEHGDAPDEDHDAWVHGKIERGLEEAKAGKIIPADEVWRRLGVER